MIRRFSRSSSYSEVANLVDKISLVTRINPRCVVALLTDLSVNHLARQNAENAIVSSMFEAGFQASETIEAFFTWLLIGPAAVASFLIANADKLVPFIGSEGFFVCGCLLCLSCVLGMPSRVLALKRKIQIQAGTAVRKTFAEHLARYIEEEKKIKESAAVRGITLETGVWLERILDEFFAPLPKWVQWLAQRHLKSGSGRLNGRFVDAVSGR